MTTLDLWIIAINMGLAFASAVSSGWAALKDDPRMRPMWAAMAAMAIVYSVAYLWLLVNPDGVVEWSRLLRGVSLVTWPLVWVLPPWLVTWRHRRDLHVIRSVGKDE